MRLGKQPKGGGRPEKILRAVEDFHKGGGRSWSVLNVRKGGRGQANYIKGGEEVKPL